ncbi:MULTISPECIES: pilus assembly protein PilB [unclassified Nodularia (in: cyanobacteria)]|uniref:GspE/PulE/PilB domain-containing protein n=1 Tax=unclassified Nodularia (in: cyanobacteria) TaxID=2656917 RepID=UPI00187FF80E|nr:MULTISPECIES: pilus assembly protein PilB [unclassified Nodularia (in: cyanobacteria)]MBE9198329.1 pilus assembly protein PilB [Nodularia sp. LEGE 06071]MCC2693065.1 pilus assembly protein PilB [Nodularia sp. LEGE 04288]
MLSSDGKPTDTRANGQQVLPNTPANWERRREQVFYLIDNLLSFEACLYHQVAPFEIEDNQLLLGMVHPQDSEALDYVSRIVSYINCTIVAQEITTDIHRTILSAYLNHKNTFRPDAKPVDNQEANEASEKSKITIIDQLIQSTTNSSQPHQTKTAQHSPQQNDFASTPKPNNLSSTTTPIPPLNNQQEEDSARLELLSKLTVLQVNVSEEFIPVEMLASLPPKKLLEELLGRVLSGGIGRLYLERQPYQGKIFWSDNGVMQSVLENLPLSLFQGVLNQLKCFASLPVGKLAEPKQVEKECLYQRNRLLLRLRVMPGTYGEEATLQVLKGTALKFYQQQQLARLSRDALGISQQLSLKLHELQERISLNPSLKSEQLDSVVALNKLVQNLDQQIKVLRATSEIPTNS